MTNSNSMKMKTMYRYDEDDFNYGKTTKSYRPTCADCHAVLTPLSSFDAHTCDVCAAKYGYYDFPDAGAMVLA